MSKDTINNPRSEIDAIDEELLRLLNKRAAIALRVGAAKSSAETSLCDPRREREVLARLRQENPGPFADTNIDSIFQRIIDESLHLQQVTYGQAGKNSQSNGQLPGRIAGADRVAFLGERGTFSEEAALGILGEGCDDRLDADVRGTFSCDRVG